MAGKTVAGETYESITGQLFEIGRQLRQPNGYPFDPNSLKEHLQAAIEGRFGSVVPVVVNTGNILQNHLDRFADFWKRRGRKVDFGIFKIPETLPAEFVLPIYVPEDLTAEQACQICEKGDKGRNAFVVKRWCDPMSFSGSAGLEKPQLLVVRDTIEPDKAWRNYSADMLRESGKLFLDLRQRVLHEAVYFDLFSKHLDVKGWTRCPESRLSDGSSADVYWGPDGGWLGVDADYPDSRDPSAGGREEVSIPLAS